MASSSPPLVYPQTMTQTHEQPYHFPSSPHLPAHSTSAQTGYAVDHPVRSGPTNYSNYPSHLIANPPHHASELDAHYWRNMFLELGFGENIDHSNGTPPGEDVRGVPPYNASSGNQQHSQQPQNHSQHAQSHHHQTQLYHHMHPTIQPGYGH